MLNYQDKPHDLSVPRLTTEAERRQVFEIVRQEAERIRRKNAQDKAQYLVKLEE